MDSLSIILLTMQFAFLVKLLSLFVFTAESQHDSAWLDPMIVHHLIDPCVILFGCRLRLHPGFSKAIS